MTGVNSCIVKVPIGMSRQDYFIHMQIPNWVGTMRKCGPNVIKDASKLSYTIAFGNDKTRLLNTHYR